MGRLHITFFIPGKSLNPFTEGQTAHELDFIKKINSLLYKPLSGVNYFYAAKTNIVIITLQNNALNLHVLKSPMVLSAILGLLLGLACHQLPAHISKSLVDNLVSPNLHLVIGMVSGIMGPVIFISLVTSITTLDSINELNSQGIRLFRRFFHIALFTTAAAILTGIIFFPALGQNNVSLDLSMVVQLFLGIFPTNIFSPFVDNNFPQLAILSLLLGAALLIISYLCILVCGLLKLAKVSFRCKVNPLWLLRKTGPLVGLIFTTGNEMSGIGKFKEISKDDFAIDPDFTSFW